MVVDAVDLEFAAAAQMLNVRGEVEGVAANGYAWVVIDLLNKLVPSDAIAWFSVDLSRNSAQMVGFPGELPDDAACHMLLELAMTTRCSLVTWRSPGMPRCLLRDD